MPQTPETRPSLFLTFFLKLTTLCAICSFSFCAYSSTSLCRQQWFIQQDLNRLNLSIDRRTGIKPLSDIKSSCQQTDCLRYDRYRNNTVRNFSLCLSSDNKKIEENNDHYKIQFIDPKTKKAKVGYVHKSHFKPITKSKTDFSLQRLLKKKQKQISRIHNPAKNYNIQYVTPAQKTKNQQRFFANDPKSYNGDLFAFPEEKVQTFSPYTPSYLVSETLPKPKVTPGTQLKTPPLLKPSSSDAFMVLLRDRPTDKDQSGKSTGRFRICPLSKKICRSSSDKDSNEHLIQLGDTPATVEQIEPFKGFLSKGQRYLPVKFFDTQKNKERYALVPADKFKKIQNLELTEAGFQFNPDCKDCSKNLNSEELVKKAQAQNPQCFYDKNTLIPLIQFPSQKTEGGLLGKTGPCGSFNYNTYGGNDGHYGQNLQKDNFLQPLTACAFGSFLQDWQTQECANPEQGCRIAFGDMSHSEALTWDGHHQHKYGNCIDLRPLKHGLFDPRRWRSWRSQESQSATQKIINKLKEYGFEHIIYKEQAPNSRTKYVNIKIDNKSHADHLHVCIPKTNKSAHKNARKKCDQAIKKPKCEMLNQFFKSDIFKNGLPKNKNLPARCKSNKKRRKGRI